MKHRYYLHKDSIYILKTLGSLLLKWSTQYFKVSNRRADLNKQAGYEKMPSWPCLLVYLLSESIKEEGEKLLKWDFSISAVTIHHTPKISHPYFHWFFYQNTSVWLIAFYALSKETYFSLKNSIYTCLMLAYNLTFSIELSFGHQLWVFDNSAVKSTLGGKCSVDLHDKQRW